MNSFFTDEETKAVLLYQGYVVPGELDPFYQQPDAYQTFNLFMMEGEDGERVRICIEGQQPNSMYIQRWPDTLDELETLFQVQCKYTCQQIRMGNPLPNPLVRGDRKVNFDQMRAAGGTVAFTSTSKNTVCNGFLDGKQDPHVLHISLEEKVPYLDFEGFFGSANSLPEEREVLLPPMVRMSCGPCWTEIHDEIGLVTHYNIVFTELDTKINVEDEARLIDFLNSNMASATEELCDLVNNKLDSRVFEDENHSYWQWKAAFRKLAVHRMITIYKRFFA